MCRSRVRAATAVLALLAATAVGCGSGASEEVAAPQVPGGTDPAATSPLPTVASTDLPTAPPTDPSGTNVAPIVAETSRTITVDGVGIVDGPPDFMEAWLGIRVTRPAVREAVDAAAGEAAMMLDALHAVGLADADLQTGDYSVYPEYAEYPTVSGYTVNYNVRVHVRELARGGEIIDAAIRAVGDDATVYGVSFGLDDDVARTTEARRLAVDDARDRAEQLAALVDGMITYVVSVDEVSVPEYGGYYGGEGETPGAPFMPGEVRTKVTVTVTFAVE